MCVHCRHHDKYRHFCKAGGRNHLHLINDMNKKGKVCLHAKWPVRPAFKFLKHGAIRNIAIPPFDASPSQGTQHEANRSITTPPPTPLPPLPLDGMLFHCRVPSMKRLGADYHFPLYGMLVHHRVPSIKQLGALLSPPWGNYMR